MSIPIPDRNQTTTKNPYQMIPHFTRDEFLHAFGEQYRSGHHITLLGPTGRGKTTLVLQMLNEVAKPDWKVTILSGKPPGRDPVMMKAAKQLNLRTVEEWPPDYRFTDKARPAIGVKGRNGYVLRPRHTMNDEDATNAELKKQFRRGLTMNYASKTPNIVVVDEGHHVSKDLGLEKSMDSILMRGAPVVSIWTLVQRGRFMSYQIYDAPEWVFVAYDPDESNRRRYGEMSGVDRRTVEAITEQLETRTVEDGRTVSEFLCIRRSGPVMCIVGID